MIFSAEFQDVLPGDGFRIDPKSDFLTVKKIENHKSSVTLFFDVTAGSEQFISAPSGQQCEIKRNENE